MYIWNVDRLVKDFRNGDISEKEKLKYMILLGVIFTIATDPILWVDSKYSIMDSVNLLLMGITTILGTYYCYTKNKSGDNKDFVTRFTCLGIPIGIRILVFAIPSGILIGVIQGIYEVGTETNKLGEVVYLTTIYQVIGGLLISIIYFAYLGKKMNQISENKPS